MSNENAAANYDMLDQNLAMGEAIRAVGSRKKLGKLIKRGKSTIRYWYTKKVKPGQNLVKKMEDAFLIEEAAGLPGIAKRIYPSLKLIQPYQ